MKRRRIIDLFCGAGGASKGYALAGFEVVGVDHKAQPNYPFEFIQHDALDLLRLMVAGAAGYDEWPLPAFEAIHAAPLWYGFTQQARQAGTEDDHRDDVAPTLALLEATGLPYVLEVGTTSPQDAQTICGVSCGLRVTRHMRFATNWPFMAPPCTHVHGGAAAGLYIPSHGSYHKEPGWRNVPQTRKAWREAAGLDWMTWKEASLASPPAYTELIGAQLMAHIRTEAK